LKWRLILNEQMKNNGYTASYDMVMSLAHAMGGGAVWNRFWMNGVHKKQKTGFTRWRNI
jgi:hypothetical protein